MSISKPFHIISVWIIITIKLFFPEGTQPSWKITEILEGGGYDKHPLVWKIWEGVGGLKQKCPLRAGMDIFRNCTLNARPLTWSLMTWKNYAHAWLNNKSRARHKMLKFLRLTLNAAPESK